MSQEFSQEELEHIRNDLQDSTLSEGDVFFSWPSGRYHRVKTLISEDDTFVSVPLARTGRGIVEGEDVEEHIADAFIRLEDGEYMTISDRAVSEPEEVMFDFATHEIQENQAMLSDAHPYSHVDEIDNVRDLLAAEFFANNIEYRTLAGTEVPACLYPLARNALLDVEADTHDPIDAAEFRAFEADQLYLNASKWPMLLEVLLKEDALVVAGVPDTRFELEEAYDVTEDSALVAAILVRSIEEYLLETIKN
jgi:hypothetical protein